MAVKLVALDRKGIPSRQVALSVAPEAIDVRVERRITKDRSKICRGREEVEIHPKTLVPLRRDERELVIGNAERFQDAATSKLRRELHAIGIGVGRKQVGSASRLCLNTEFAATRRAALSILITAKGPRRRADVRNDIAVIDDVS